MRTIAFRLAMAFLCIILFLLLQGGFAYYGFQKIDHVHRQALSHENTTSDLRALLIDTRLRMYRLIGTFNPAEMDRQRLMISQNLKELESRLGAQMVSRSLVDQNIRLYKEIIQQHYDFYPETARKLLNTKSKAKHDALFAQIENHARKTAAQHQSKIEQTRERMLYATIGLLAVALLVSGIWAAILAGTLTDKRRAEQELRNSEERLRAIFEAAENVAFVITDAKDPEPRVLEFSPGAEQVFEYSREEIVGTPVSVLHLPEDVEKFPKAHDNMRRGKPGFKGETMLVRKSGEQFPALFSTYPLFDQEGGMFAALSVCVDISERKNLENQLQQVRKMEAVGTLAGGIAHDFNNMLTIIMGNAELANTVKNSGEPIDDNLNAIIKTSLRAKDVVNQLLSFSRKTKIDKQKIDIADIVREHADLLRSSIPTTISIKYQIDDNLTPVYADPTQIYQVIINLAANAAHAMEDEGGQLSIEIKAVDLEIPQRDEFGEIPAGRYVQLVMRDTGAGMPSEMIERIFDPYFTTKEVGKGSGMGLAVVHGIVEYHGGYIRVESQPEKGTAFQIWLPAADQ